ncbi:MAG TPA: hypothetical protein V6D06_07375 [Trichocoleus sp.]
MASSSRPFQSQTATRLLSAYRAWSHKTQEVLKRARVGVVWGAQVALYPVYVLFQTGRILYRQVAAVDPVGSLTRLLKPFSRMPQNEPSRVDDARLTAAEPPPVERLLLWLQMPTHSTLDAALLGLPHDCVDLASSSFGQKPPLLRVQELEKLTIEGIATNLEHRTLVLVTRGNTVLDVLSEAEQAALGRAILWLIADQNYAQWRQRQRLAASKLPLLSPSRRAWWPVQLFQHLMRWMSTGPVAATTNLFGESSWAYRAHVRQRLGNQSLLRSSLQRQAAAEVQALTSESSSYQQPESQRQLVGVGTSSWPISRSEMAELEPEQVAQSSLQSQVPSQTSRAFQGELQKQASAAASAGAVLPEAGWIEAKATVVSYVDHPLVLVLRWIDQGLLWLESLAQQGWKWVRSHLTL